jgi:hypothetical protein
MHNFTVAVSLKLKTEAVGVYYAAATAAAAAALTM